MARLSSVTSSAFLAMTGGATDTLSQVGGAEQTAPQEDVYVVRTIRETSIPPSAFCATERIGLNDVRAEERYSLRSTTTRSSDGLVLDADVASVGGLHACFGRTEDPSTSSFYGEFTVGHLTFTAVGECRAYRTNYPEEGLTILRCGSELRNVPPGYVGGQLTTNSLTSKSPTGQRTEPEGYIQSSMVTVRLWRRR